MRTLLLVLALTQMSGPTSLGVGIDVLPQAYGFAARRVGASGDLRLISCTSERCLWTLGDSVTVTANFRPDLDVEQIEATLDLKGAMEFALRRRYEEACLTIVALVDPRAPADEQRATATAIAALSGERPRRFRLELAERYVRVYGTQAAGDVTKAAIALRCGAIAVR